MGSGKIASFLQVPCLEPGNELRHKDEWLSLSRGVLLPGSAETVAVANRVNRVPAPLCDDTDGSFNVHCAVILNEEGHQTLTLAKSRIGKDIACAFENRDGLCYERGKVELHLGTCRSIELVDEVEIRPVRMKLHHLPVI